MTEVDAEKMMMRKFCSAHMESFAYEITLKSNCYKMLWTIIINILHQLSHKDIQRILFRCLNIFILRGSCHLQLCMRNMHDLLFLMQIIKKPDTFKVYMIIFMTFKNFKFMEDFLLKNAITAKMVFLLIVS